MRIRFFDFAKKENSTRRPAMTDGVVFECYLKDGTSVVDPVIVLDLPDKTNFTKFTYAYIPDFGRFYFVRDMTADGLMWDVSLVCDVLATYKPDIGSSTLYVLRSSYAYDGDLVDDYYPLGVTHTNRRITANNPLVANGSNAYANVNNGCFILGIVGATGVIYSQDAVYGSIHYFAFDRENLVKLITKLLDNAIWNTHLDNADMSIELQKSIIDPMQFIKSCIWVPVPYSDINQNTMTSIWAFGIQFPDIEAKEVALNPPHKLFTTSIDIPKHPLAASRGVYMNTEPFSRYQLWYPPFGLFDLDTTAMCSGTSLSLSADVDLITGAGKLTVSGEGDGKYLVLAKSQVGVPVQLSQISYDYVGSATGLFGGAVGMISSALSGSLSGVAMSAAGMIGTAVNAMRPSVSSVGGNGGYSDLSGRITLLAQFYHMPQEDNSHAGRPLCENRQLSTLPGYQKIMDGDVAINGTAGEQAAIKAYLEGGYFYE